MPRNACLLLGSLLLLGFGAAQSTSRPKYADHAIIRHTSSEVTVIANYPIPLFQAISDLRLEYGWQISWESAPTYSRFDVVDDTDPKWRAEHPSDKGVTRPAGGLFTGSFRDPQSKSNPDAEQEALETLIEQYNATDNPGKYVLRGDADRGFTIIGARVRDNAGVLKEIAPLLDVPVTITKQPRNVYDTIESILIALQFSTGQKVIFAVPSSSLFINAQVTLGGEKIPARELLKKAFASTKRPVQYDLMFDPDVPVYILNASPAMKEEDNGLGGRTLVPVDRSTTH